MHWNLVTSATIGLLVSCSSPPSPPASSAETISSTTRSDSVEPQHPAVPPSTVGLEVSGGPTSTPISTVPQTEAISPSAGPVSFHADYPPTVTPLISTMPDDSASADSVARWAATSWATETVDSPDQASEARQAGAASVIDSHAIDDGLHAHVQVTLEVVDEGTGEPQHLAIDVVLRQEDETWIVTSMELAR